jgi:Type ISP C-terminal specificity domain
LLDRVFGFELLMAPYAVAHLKLGMELQNTGYKFDSDQRLGIYLTNTLEEAAKKSYKLFAQWISEEANAAAEIKRNLMKADRLDEFLTEFSVKGDNIVEKADHAPDKKQVWINQTQYFGGVPENLWDFYVGGYQPCQKWLQDRKGRKLSYDDVQHWQRMVVAPAETIRLTNEIDELFPGWPLP